MGRRSECWQPAQLGGLTKCAVSAGCGVVVGVRHEALRHIALNQRTAMVEEAGDNAKRARDVAVQDTEFLVVPVAGRMPKILMRTPPDR